VLRWNSAAVFSSITATSVCSVRRAISFFELLDGGALWRMTRRLPGMSILCQSWGNTQMSNIHTSPHGFGVTGSWPADDPLYILSSIGLGTTATAGDRIFESARLAKVPNLIGWLIDCCLTAHSTQTGYIVPYEYEIYCVWPWQDNHTIKQVVRVATHAPPLILPQWAPKPSRAAEQTQCSSTFPRRIRSHADRCNRVTR